MKIPWPRCALRALQILSFGAIASAAFASLDSDLKRITPVPADQPIPTVDFFRPPLLEDPQLNLSGTYFAAIVSAEEDRHQLFVSELGAQNPEIIGGSGDKDVYDFTWLTDRRVMFYLGTKKHWGVGLLAADIGKISDAHPILQYYGTRLISVRESDRARPLVWNRGSINTDKDQGVAVVNTDKILESISNRPAP